MKNLNFFLLFAFYMLSFHPLGQAIVMSCNILEVPTDTLPPKQVLLFGDHHRGLVHDIEKQQEQFYELVKKYNPIVLIEQAIPFIQDNCWTSYHILATIKKTWEAKYAANQIDNRTTFKDCEVRKAALAFLAVLLNRCVDSFKDYTVEVDGETVPYLSVTFNHLKKEYTSLKNIFLSRIPKISSLSKDQQQVIIDLIHDMDNKWNNLQERIDSEGFDMHMPVQQLITQIKQSQESINQVHLLISDYSFLLLEIKFLLEMYEEKKSSVFILAGALHTKRLRKILTERMSAQVLAEIVNNEYISVDGQLHGIYGLWQWLLSNIYKKPRMCEIKENLIDLYHVLTVLQNIDDLKPYPDSTSAWIIINQHID